VIFIRENSVRMKTIMGIILIILVLEVLIFLSYQIYKKKELLPNQKLIIDLINQLLGEE